MRIMPINNNANNLGFSGKLVQNQMLKDFCDSLNAKEKNNFAMQIKRMEMENDGREFMFTKCQDYSSLNQNVGIFEKIKYGKNEMWLPQWTAKKEQAKGLFAQLDKMYRIEQ